jgi:hypothetical protein
MQTDSGNILWWLFPWNAFVYKAKQAELTNYKLFNLGQKFSQNFGFKISRYEHKYSYFRDGRNF